MTQNQASKATLPFGCSHRYKKLYGSHHELVDHYKNIHCSKYNGYFPFYVYLLYPQSPTRLSSHLSMRNMAGVLMKQYKNIFFWKKETPSALKHTTRKK